jgi:predicted RNA-binding protein
MAIEAKKSGASRALLESTAALDPVIADFIYIVDHKLASAGLSDPGCNGNNLLNTWHSFSRPEVIRLQERMCHHIAQCDVFLMLPCSRHRPYGDSRTHTRLARQLHDLIPRCAERAERVVVTSLGVVPEAFWREPLVMSYDAGAVDLWRVFQLLRMFFTVNKARSVIDCLSFKPYSDMLSLLKTLGTVHDVSRPLRVRWRSFHVKLR